MVRIFTPLSVIHTASVAPDKASGMPEEKPSRMTMSTRGLR
jgi:hypothetical protein